jgi:hypothetical protein
MFIVAASSPEQKHPGAPAGGHVPRACAPSEDPSCREIGAARAWLVVAWRASAACTSAAPLPSSASAAMPSNPPASVHQGNRSATRAWRASRGLRRPATAGAAGR